MAQHTLIFDQRPRASKRLFCFPYAGVSSAIYRPWSQVLPEDWELVAVDYPGRMHMANRPAEDMKSLLAAVYPDVLTLMDRPCRFFGHSFGAMVAYALARRLHAENKPMPEALYASSRTAPQIPSGQPDVRGLDQKTLVEVVEARYAAIPAIIKNEPALLQKMLPILQADLIINAEYQSDLDNLLDIPVTVLYSSTDSVVSKAGVEAWREVTSADCSLLEFEGGHFFIDTKRDELIKLLSS